MYIEIKSSHVCCYRKTARDEPACGEMWRLADDIADIPTFAVADAVFRAFEFACICREPDKKQSLCLDLAFLLADDHLVPPSSRTQTECGKER